MSLILTVVFAIANVEADLTSTQKMQLLNTHNAVRRSVQPPATDIKTMVRTCLSEDIIYHQSVVQMRNVLLFGPMYNA